MQENDKNALIRLKMEIVKNKIKSKKRYSESEKDYFKKCVVVLAYDIGEVVKDENLTQVFSQKMDFSSRKQMVHIKKALSELDEMLKVIESFK